MPSDTSVFSALHNLYDSDLGNSKRPTTTLGGASIVWENLTTEYYTVQWYVLKDQGVWHVDGVIVVKAQQPETTSFAVFKEWSDSEAVQHDNDAIQVRLYADGTPVGEAQNLDESGSYYWYGLPKYNGEVEIEYTVAETHVPANYSASYSYLDTNGEGQYDAANVCIITNTYNPYNPPVYDTYYTLTVKWVDADGGASVADPVSSRKIAGSSYDAVNVEGGSDRIIEGYTYSGSLAEGSDDANGTMNGNKTVTFVYNKNITDDGTPLDPGSDEEIPDNGNPMDDSPATGDNAPLALLWFAFCASLCGLIVLKVISPRKRRDGSR
jgi:hypothetical protein